MEDQYYTKTILVDKTPMEAFGAINNVRGWWSGKIEGSTTRLGDEFTYNVPGVHWCKMKITQLTPGKKVVWHVLDSDLQYTKARTEWNGTDISFELSEKDGETQVLFEHIGLVPAYECYTDCADAWGMFISGSLKNLITTGKDQPSPFETKD